MFIRDTASLTELLPHHQTSYTQFGRPYAVIMTEGSAAFAHDHGFQPAGAFQFQLVGVAAVSKFLNRDLRVLARQACGSV